MFRKKMPCVKLAHPTPVYDTLMRTSKEVLEDGRTITRAYFETIEVSSKEYLKQFPNPLDVTLENQLATGEMLNEVRLNLTPTDSAFLDHASIAMTNQFMNHIPDNIKTILEK